MNETGWIYPKLLLGDNPLKYYNSFVYLVDFKALRKKYIGYKSITYRTGRDSNWKTYKTSSKLVKRLLKEGNKADFYILRFFKTREEGLNFEKELIERENAVMSGRFLNQSSGSSYMRHELSYNDEWRENVSNSLINYYSAEGTVHPLKGKVHPNKGKYLPQTAPLEHASVNKVMVTDGFVNKWYDKKLPLEDGFRIGITHHSKGSGQSKEVMKVLSERNHQDSLSKYLRSPKICPICGGVLEYPERYLKTHAGECRSKHRGSITSNIKQSKESYRKGLEKRLDNIARVRGFKSYLELSCSVVIDLLNGLTYDKVSGKYDIARSTALNMKKRLCEKSGDLEGVEYIEQLLKKLEDKI